MNEDELEAIEEKANWSGWDRNASREIILQLLIEIKRLNKIITKALQVRYG